MIPFMCWCVAVMCENITTCLLRILILKYRKLKIKLEYLKLMNNIIDPEKIATNIACWEMRAKRRGFESISAINHSNTPTDWIYIYGKKK